MTPGLRRDAVTWAIREKDYSQRRACRLVGIDPKTWRYASCRPDDNAARARLRELAGERHRFGYRRLHILLDREGIAMNHKKLFRLYREEGLSVRKRGGRKRALGARSPMVLPDGRNQRWSLDFVSDALSSGTALSGADGGRRLHPGMPRPGRRHIAVGRTTGPRTGPDRRKAEAFP